MRNSLSFLILLFFSFCSFSQNLVPNSSFENLISCPPGAGINQIQYCPPWIDPSSGGGGADVYNTCITEISTIPNFGLGSYVGGGGGEWPRTGNGFVGIFVWGNPSLGFPDVREFLSAKLEDSLEENTTYRIEFYISLLDSYRYAITNMGVFFSKLPLPIVNQPFDLNYYYSLSPQIINSNSSFLSNKNGWTKISGRFTAEGGEEYITVGNFSSDLQTNYLMVDSSTWHQYNNPDSFSFLTDFAYYLIDDISVWKDTTTGFEESETFDFNFYPNPAKENISIQFTNGSKKLTATILSISGQQLLKQSIGNKNSIDLSTIPNGVYYIEIANKRQKLFINK